MVSADQDPAFSPPETLTVGYALSPRKQQATVTPTLLSLAASRGLRLLPLDPSLPISQPLHLVIHKLYDGLWTYNLAEFAARNPSVPIVDPPELIRRIQDRVSMLRFVSDLRLPSNRELKPDAGTENPHPCTFGVPKQITIQDAAGLADPAVISEISFPVLAKPLAADGSSGSHQMALVFSQDGLLKQHHPLVLQEFVNHGGVVFKVYVAGDYAQCVKRESLPDLADETLAAFGQIGFVSFSQISNMAPESSAGVDPLHSDKIVMPPDDFIKEIADGLRNATGLHLFNFDMIMDKRVGNHYLVIDINYFPGFDKLPGHEKILTDFLCSVLHKEEEGGSGLPLRDDDSENQKPSCTNDVDGEK